MSRLWTSRPAIWTAAFVGFAAGLSVALAIQGVPRWLASAVNGPVGGAALTVLGGSIVGWFAYSQGNKRLDYERERDRLDRAEANRVRHYEEEKETLIQMERLRADVHQMVTNLEAGETARFDLVKRTYLDRIAAWGDDFLSDRVQLLFPGTELMLRLGQCMEIANRLESADPVPREETHKRLEETYSAVEKRFAAMRNPATENNDGAASQ